MENFHKDLLDSLNNYKLVDLFAGTGAFSYVFSKFKNVECVFANDFCKKSENIYNKNHSIKLNNLDILDLKLEDIPSHDILCAGFSCQPFSIAGKQKGFKDERSNVFWKILEIIEAKSPKVIIMENVKNLKSHDNGTTFNIIKENIEKLSYTIYYDIINTCKITNIPHNRERIYIICFKNPELSIKFDFPTCKNDKIIDFIEDNIPDKYYYTDKYKIYQTCVDNITKNIKENVLYQYRRYYVRENKNNVCPTLTANMGTGGHNVPLLLDDKGIRKLTPRECFNLQGFPKNYILPSNLSDNALYTLAGNGVSIPVVEKIAEKIMEII
tara:strand:- start:4937 stop:5914 length:978 start_codon:yes stop_codon:yes gene_type:complete